MQQTESSHINHIDTDEINIKEIFSVLLHYKKSIFLIVTITTLYAFTLAYFSPNIYQTQTMIKITPEDYSNNPSDFIAMAMGKEGSNIQDELVIFNTQDIALKALKNLNLGTRYYVTKYFKTHELYKDSPFIVSSEFIAPKAKGVLFHLIPINEKKFRLLIEPSFKTKIINTLYNYITPIHEKNRPLYYNKIHQFGQRINAPWFTITVQKTHNLDDLKYSFTVSQNNDMSGLILGGVTTSANNEFGNIITLNFQDNVPLRAKEILDAVVNTYIEENLKSKSEAAEKKLYFIDQQLNAIDEVLKDSSEKLQKYKASNIIVNLGNEAELATKKLSDIESQFYEINMQIDIMNNILQYMNTHNNIRGIYIDAISNTNSSINHIIEEMKKIDVLRMSMLVKHTESHPMIIQSSKKLDSLKKSLKESILGSLRTLKEKRIAIQGLIEKYKSTLEQLPAQEQKLGQLTRSFVINENIYSYLLKKRAETAIVKASTVPGARVIEKANIPGGAIKPKRSLFIFIGFILGLILGIFLAFIREFFNNTVKTIEDIEKLTDIPIYGVIPHRDSPKSIFHYREAIQTLWTNLEFLQKKGKSKLITFTSSVSKEGKTLTIYQLGNIIAENHKSVIIIDLDMRKSKLHEKFKLPNTIGMSTLLAQKNTLVEVIQDTKYDNLKVITSGVIPPNPTGLIMSDILESILNELMEEYNYILIDSPPIGLVADAMKIMRLSDITLIVFKENYSKKDFIKNINRLTKDSNINPGIILNDTKMGKNYGYGYGYGYD